MNVARETITRLETNRTRLTVEQLLEYAKHCNVTVNEIIGMMKDPIEDDLVFLLRANSAIYFTEEIRRAFEIWYKRYAALMLKVNFHPARTWFSYAYDESGDIREQAKDAARKARLLWGLGTAPIDDPVSLVHSLGIFIAGRDFGSDKLFGLTGICNHTDRFGILINTHRTIPIERQRFSIFHELSHIIAHRNEFIEKPNQIGKGKGKDKVEIFADVFSGEFQIPAEEFLRVYQTNFNAPTDESIFYLKKYFKVSYKTIIYRLRDTECIDQYQCGQLFNKFKRIYGEITEPQPITDKLRFDQETEIVQSAIESRLITQPEAQKMGFLNGPMFEMS